MNNYKLYFENMVEIQRAILDAGGDPFAVCHKYEFEEVIRILSDNNIIITATNNSVDSKLND